MNNNMASSSMEDYILYDTSGISTYAPASIYIQPSITTATTPSYLNSTYSNTSIPNTSIHVNGSNPILSTDKSKINLDELAGMMEIMRERLLIIVPDFEKHEKYEALKKAYDHYKLIEAMVMGKENG